MLSRRKKGVAIGIGVIAALWLIAVIILPRLFDPNTYRGKLTRLLEEALGARVTIGELEWGLSNGVWLTADGFSIRNADRFPVDVELPNLYVKAALLPLIWKTVEIKTIELTGPTFDIDLSPSPSSAKQSQPASGKPAGTASSSLPVMVTIDELAIRNARINLRDRISIPGKTLKRTYERVELTAEDLAPGDEIKAQLTLTETTTPGIGTLTVAARFSGLTHRLTIEDPRLDVQADLNDFQSAVIKPYLKGHPVADRLDGRVSLSITYSGDFGQRFVTSGSVNLEHLAYSDAALWDRPLPGGKATLVFGAALSPDRIDINRVNLTINETRIDGRAAVENWRTDPVIEQTTLTGTLKLSDVKPLVPWKAFGERMSPARSALGDGGVIQIKAVALPPLKLKSPPKDWKPFVSAIEADLQLTDISVRPNPNLPPVNRINGSFRLEKGGLTVKELVAFLGPLGLPSIDARVDKLIDRPQITARVNGPLIADAQTDPVLAEKLSHYGLSELSGKAVVMANLFYDTAAPSRWRADGKVDLSDVRIRAAGKTVGIDHLNGRLTLNRRDSLTVALENVSGNVAGAPFRLSADLREIGTPRFTIEAVGNTRELDIGQVAALIPNVAELNLQGRLNMDASMRLPYDQPERVRVNGNLNLAAVGFRSPDRRWHLAGGRADLAFADRTVTITEMDFRMNDQPFTVTATIDNPVSPIVKAVVRSPQLNLDQLLPPSAKSAAEQKPQPAPQSGADRAKRSLPELARKLVATLDMKATKGVYRNQAFGNLDLQADYIRGAVKNIRFSADTAGGRIQARGSADVNDLAHIPFSVSPDIKQLDIDALAALFGHPRIPVNGSLSISGHMKGRTGDTKETFRSLNGNLKINVVKGRLFEIGETGKLITDILTIANVRGVLSRNPIRSMTAEGLPFEKIDTDLSFAGGHLNVKPLLFKSHSINAGTSGAINLIDRTMDLDAKIEPLVAVSGIVGKLPVLGKESRNLTRVSLSIKGPIDNPEIRLKPFEALSETTRGVLTIPGSKGNKQLEEAGKELQKLFRKR